MAEPCPASDPKNAPEGLRRWQKMLYDSKLNSQTLSEDHPNRGEISTSRPAMTGKLAQPTAPFTMKRICIENGLSLISGISANRVF